MSEYRPEAYQDARVFLDVLNRHRRKMTTDTYLGIKSMALRGDLSVAMTLLRLVLEGKVKA